jgi:hypothetical protein
VWLDSYNEKLRVMFMIKYYPYISWKKYIQYYICPDCLRYYRVVVAEKEEQGREAGRGRERKKSDLLVIYSFLMKII